MAALSIPETRFTGTTSTCGDFGSPAPPSTTPGNRDIGVADLVQATGVSAPGGLTGDVQPM